MIQDFQEDAIRFSDRMDRMDKIVSLMRAKIFDTKIFGLGDSSIHLQTGLRMARCVVDPPFG